MQQRRVGLVVPWAPQIVSLKIKMSKSPEGWDYWWVKHHDLTENVDTPPIEVQGSKTPTEAYTFENVGNICYFIYGGNGGIIGLFSFTTHALTVKDDKLYIINLETNWPYEEGKPWQGWRPSLNPLPWGPSKGPPLPQGLAPPWPWVWFGS